MNKNSIFKDQNLECEFKEYRYIRVPFLNEVEVCRLKEKYQDLHPHDYRQNTLPNYASGYFASKFINDESYRRLVTDAVVPEFQRAIDLYFKGTRCLGAAFWSSCRMRGVDYRFIRT